MDLINELPFQDPFQGKRCGFFFQTVFKQQWQTQETRTSTKNCTFNHSQTHRLNPSLQQNF